MARLLFILLLAGLAWYGWRVFRRYQEQLSKPLKEAETSLRKDKAVELEKDPESGVYRPRDRDR